MHIYAYMYITSMSLCASVRALAFGVLVLILHLRHDMSPENDIECVCDVPTYVKSIAYESVCVCHYAYNAFRHSCTVCMDQQA